MVSASSKNSCSSSLAGAFSLLCRIALIVGFVQGFAGTISAQATLTVTSNGSVVNAGGNLFIDQNPQMPNINLEVTGACGTVEFQLDFQWFSPSGQGTFYQYPTATFPTGQQVAIDWSQLTDGPIGGQATLTWTVFTNGSGTGGGGTFQFNVLGTNPLNSDVDFIASLPWFYRYILSEETANIAPAGIYHQFDSSGFPVVANNPNGVGMAQLEPPALCCSHDFWDWSANLGDGLRLLNSKQPAAYANWNNELADMLNNNGGKPVWPHWAMGACTFDASPPSGAPAAGAHSFADADWLKNYNGNYFIFWNPPSAAGVAGFWDINSAGRTDYVPKVCTSPLL